jgi:peptidylprolyl isomerase
MIENGKYVQIQYTGTFENGELFDSNVGQQPLEFQVGSGTIITGLEKAIQNMELNDEKDVKVNPENGYGDRNSDFVLTVPRAEVQNNFNPEPGMIISIQMENGQLIPARITEVDSENVILDLNHPLAGKTLYFKVKLIAVTDEQQFDNCECCSSDSCESGECC